MADIHMQGHHALIDLAWALDVLISLLILHSRAFQWDDVLLLPCTVEFMCKQCVVRWYSCSASFCFVGNDQPGKR